MFIVIYYNHNLLKKLEIFLVFFYKTAYLKFIQRKLTRIIIQNNDKTNRNYSIK